jgi:hypothetical protein
MLEVAALRSWWVFRGQASWKWRLEPSIERGNPPESWMDVEREEVERARALDTGQADLRDHLAWLARLRHENRPVRLLDFTRSLAVAVHFATREASEDLPAIWAVDGIRLEVAWRNQLIPGHEALVIQSPSGNCDEFNALYERRSGVTAAMFVDPQAPNRRQQLQQGVFLVGLDLTRSLEDNLFGCLGHLPEDVNPDVREGRPLNRPMGMYVAPLGESAERNVKDALVVQMQLDVRREELAAYLAEEGVSPESLGF